MRKVVILIMMLSIFLVLCGCNTRLTIEQSKNNFSVYYDLLKNVSNRYELELNETKDINIENQDSYKDFTIYVDSNSLIEIRILNSAYDSKKGVESFSVDYKISNVDFKGEFNIPLFVDLVNCISGKNISVDFCSEFLNAPESKYSVKKYGYEKSNNKIISKQYALDFFEDWNISYNLTTEEEILTFGGLTQS